MYGRCPVVYVAIMADDARPADQELEYSDDFVIEFEDICVAHDEYLMDADVSVVSRHFRPCTLRTQDEGHCICISEPTLY